MSEGNPDARSMAMRLAAQTVALNPANQMAVPTQSTPIAQGQGSSFPAELAGSSMIPKQPIQQKVFEDDGLGDFDESVTQQLVNNVTPNVNHPTHQNPPQPSFQPKPTAHQAVFSPDLQGTILRKLSTIEKTVLTLTEKLNTIGKKLDVWETRIEFKEDDK